MVLFRHVHRRNLSENLIHKHDVRIFTIQPHSLSLSITMHRLNKCQILTKVWVRRDYSVTSRFAHLHFLRNLLDLWERSPLCESSLQRLKYLTDFHRVWSESDFIPMPALLVISYNKAKARICDTITVRAPFILRSWNIWQWTDMKHLLTLSVPN
jgi:hypothetical protein